MAEAFRVSQSKVKTYRRCKYAYHLKYREKLRRRRVSRPLQFGRLIHEAIEASIEGDDPLELLDNISFEKGKYFAAEREAYGEILEDVRIIIAEYLEYYKDDGLRYVRINKRSAEHEFNVEIAPGVELTGKLDAVAKTPNRLRWLMEHKSFSKAPNEDDYWRNLQSVTYIRAMEILGWPKVDGTLWDFVHSKAPSAPQILKSGSLSKKALNSLPTKVLQVIAHHGLDPDDYPTLIASAENNRRRYFHRVFTPVKADVVDMVFNDFLHTAVEMSRAPEDEKQKNIDKHCSWCDFEAICRAELQGLDVEYVKEKEYYINDHEQENAESEPPKQSSRGRNARNARRRPQ